MQKRTIQLDKSFTTYRHELPLTTQRADTPFFVKMAGTILVSSIFGFTVVTILEKML